MSNEKEEKMVEQDRDVRQSDVKAKETSEKGARLEKEEAAMKRRATAERRLRLHRIRVACTVAGTILALFVLFWSFIAHYNFSIRAWVVTYDPIHGYAYTRYSSQQYSHARIVIDKCLSSKEEVTVPDTIFGARVEEFKDRSFKDSVKTIHLGRYVTIIGEGFSDKRLVMAPKEQRNIVGEGKKYLSIKDKDSSGFYYKSLDDDTLVAYAYFGTQEQYSVPSSLCGIKVSKATEYYVNDDYLSMLADVFHTHTGIFAYNMLRVKMIQKNAIDPYMHSLEDKESRDSLRDCLLDLPDNYDFNPDGSPSNGETAIKLAMINNGDGKGNNCAIVMARYDPLEFVRAMHYLSIHSSVCHTENELDLEEWLADGFVDVA